MMKTIKPILKVFLFIATVLLVGQIPVGTVTVGSWFGHSVLATCRAGAQAVETSQWYNKLSESPVIAAWLKGPNPTSPEPEPEKAKPHTSRPRHSELRPEVMKEDIKIGDIKPEEAKPEETRIGEDGEKINSSDRESLIRLLE